MVQVSTTMAVAFMAATASALPFGSWFKVPQVTKRLSALNWITVYNHDPDVHVGPAPREERLYVELDTCTTLENMWDKETRYVEIGPGLMCSLWQSENCESLGTEGDSQWFSGSETTSSGIHPVDISPAWHGHVNSYLCHYLNWTIPAPRPDAH